MIFLIIISIYLIIGFVFFYLEQEQSPEYFKQFYPLEYLFMMLWIVVTWLPDLIEFMINNDNEETN